MVEISRLIVFVRYHYGNLIRRWACIDDWTSVRKSMSSCLTD